MGKLLIVANWKSNKTLVEAEEWIKQFTVHSLPSTANLEIVVCPPFTLLSLVRSQLTTHNSQLTLGAQDVSPFPDGAYTGEVSAGMLKDLGVEYVLIGHSERRKYLKEDEQLLTNKVKETLDAGLTPIFCVQGKTTPVPEGVKIILYEPLTAIGSGNPSTPEEANEVAKTLREILGQEAIILYGGSVDSENVADFCRQENISGVGVGGASLDPEKFLAITQNAAKI